jgi:hypothetical protein
MRALFYIPEFQNNFSYAWKIKSKIKEIGYTIESFSNDNHATFEKFKNKIDSLKKENINHLLIFFFGDCQNNCLVFKDSRIKIEIIMRLLNDELKNTQNIIFVESDHDGFPNK